VAPEAGGGLGAPEPAIYTIGHSTRTVEAFVELLADAAVETLADIRKLPGSRAHPQFSGESLVRELERAGMAYVYLAGLGGRRGRSRAIPPDVNGYWTNQSFHNYADYALTGEFQAALAELRQIGRRSTCAIMCAEAVWWRCHRRIVADHLIAAGHTVLHIMARGRVERAELTAGAVVHSPACVTYPAPGADARLAAAGSSHRHGC
jgi:uncharacterized protein (DUF488 family)